MEHLGHFKRYLASSFEAKLHDFEEPYSASVLCSPLPPYIEFRDEYDMSLLFMCDTLILSPGDPLITAGGGADLKLN